MNCKVEPNKSFKPLAKARSDALHSAPAAHAFGIVAQQALRAKRRLTGR